MDLYRELGVDRTAGAAEIKAAYRAAAKKRHPDHGGDKDSFARLNAAKALLLDPKRRARYDATGEQDSGVDNEQAEILQVAMAAIDHVLRVIEQRHADPCSYDIIGDARIGLSKDIENAKEEQKRLETGADSVRRIIARIKPKEGKVDRLTPMFNARVVDLERRVAQQKQSIEKLKAAYGLLGEHTFCSEPKPFADSMDPFRLSRSPFGFGATS